MKIEEIKEMKKIKKRGDLKKHFPRIPTVREEMRRNLIRMLEEKKPLFQDLKGYDDTVIPQVINAIICGHNMIILGERGQGKSKIIRDLLNFLDEYIPALSGCPIHDNPYSPVCADCRQKVEIHGDDLPIDWIPRDRRLVEKLATSDVSTADLIGEVDPIKISQGRTLDDETAIHFGLIPRANRGIFAINELPDLAEKIQVALFNVMEERDLQIKGFPVRLPLDVLVVASANPEDYTSRGRIITPLKDRFDAQIKTHYPQERRIEIEIMEQEARNISLNGLESHAPLFIKEILAEMTLQARSSPDISQHSGVSCRATIRSYEAIMGSALRRCLVLGEKKVVPRITDIESTFPAIAGKLELEYGGKDRKEGEIVEELAKRATKAVFDELFKMDSLSSVINAFHNGMGAEVSQSIPSDEYMDGVRSIPGLKEAVKSLVNPESPAEVSSAIEFILEGLHLSNKLNKEIINGRIVYK
jgi:magnesium chelatase subunit I